MSGSSHMPPISKLADSPQPTPAEVLATPVEFVRGVGPQRAELLARLDVRTAGDLIFFFPRDYQDLTDRRAIADLEEDHVQTVRGEVVEVDARSSGFGKSVVGVLVRAGQRLPAGDLVQPAVHAREVSRGAARAALGQAAVARRPLGDGRIRE